VLTKDMREINGIRSFFMAKQFSDETQKVIISEETEEKLVASLTGETTELLPFLPYLLQDFWELGSEPAIMVDLVKRHGSLTEKIKVLDLACGKGAVSVRLAKELGVKVKGIDLMSDFVEIAKQKAKEHDVYDLCDFVVGDINEAIKTERDYDFVVFGSAGNILGTPDEMLSKLKSTVKKGGFVLFDECYLPDDYTPGHIRYDNYEYITKKQWDDLFSKAGLVLVEAVLDSASDDTDNLDSTSGMNVITKRAHELISKYPDKKEMFEGYIKSQQNEYDDLDNTLVAVTWILKA
jgi:ubiquinone/menaquinone biosynthesis C-methylase UbiE